MCIYLSLETEVNKKLRSVRTQFGREFAKVKKKKTGTGADEVYISKWVHFEKLMFLKDFVILKNSTSNLEVSIKYVNIVSIDNILELILYHIILP